MYLYENSDPPPAHVIDQLRDFVASGFVTFEAVGKPASQLYIYHACAVQHRHKHSWLTFIDIDEFIVLRKCGPRALPVLRRRRSACFVGTSACSARLATTAHSTEIANEQRPELLRVRAGKTPHSSSFYMASATRRRSPSTGY